MGIYSFQSRFERRILTGRKRQTIRATRKHPDAVGDWMHLYGGLRKPGAHLLMRVRCRRIDRIAITQTGDVYINLRRLEPREKRRLAIADGFTSFGEMMMFWRDRLPFAGHIYHWTYSAVERARQLRIKNGTEMVCRMCWCSETCACIGGCAWAEPNLCTRCARKAAA